MRSKIQEIRYGAVSFLRYIINLSPNSENVGIRKKFLQLEAKLVVV